MAKKNNCEITGKFESVWRDEMCNEIIELARSDKLTTQSIICLHLGISLETWDRWTNPQLSTFNQDFFEAVIIALTYMRARWEQYGIDRLEDTGEPQLDSSGIKWTKFNDRLWSKFMARYHDYVDLKSSSTNKIQAAVAGMAGDDEELKKRVDELWKEF